MTPGNALHRHHQLGSLAEHLKSKLANFGDSFDILLTDFYDFEPDEPFDSIVIMGVIEHLPNYERVLKKFIGSSSQAAACSSTAAPPRRNTSCRPSWCGTSILAITHSSCSTICSSKTDLEVMEVQNDRWSYFLTFRQWARNLESNKDYVRSSFGDFEYRKFRLYLWGAAYEFLARNLDCYRLILYKPNDAA